MPQVSIGMPLYNGEQYLRMALDSLLSQTFDDFELIICDNASTDSTALICQEYVQIDKRIKFYQNESNIGAAKNFQKVLDLASADFFMWAAHDDLWDNSYISKCLTRLEECPTALLCCSEIYFINEDGSLRASWTYDNIETLDMNLYDRVNQLFLRMGWFAIYGLIRRKSILNLTIRNEYGMDVLVLIEILLKGDFCKVPEQLFYYRVTDQGKTPETYMLDINSTVSGNSIANNPYSNLAFNLVKIVYDSTLKEAQKLILSTNIILSLVMNNKAWLSKILEEQAFILTSNTTYAQLFNLLSNVFQPLALSPSFQRKVILFFPHNPYPPKSGAHRRCLSVLDAFKKLDYQVILISSNLFTDTPWTEASIQSLESQYGLDLYLCKSSIQEQHTFISENGVISPWHMYEVPSLKESFRLLCLAWQPNIVMVSYAYWSGLIRSKDLQQFVTVIDTLDLVSVNSRMWQAVNDILENKFLPREAMLSQLLSEDFFDAVDLEASADEYSKINTFDFAIAIAPLEAELIRQYAPQTSTLYIPMSFPIYPVINSYQGGPVFVASNNPFNFQGYLYFVCKVLPKIKATLPEFSLTMVGNICKQVPIMDGIESLGYVEQLTEVYQQSSFAISPIFGGTGQQIKVIEAMSHGLAVIIMAKVAQALPIQQGLNGFIVSNADEFAWAVIYLVTHPEVCRDLGSAARQTILETYSESQLLTSLQPISQASENPLYKLKNLKLKEYNLVIFPKWDQLEDNLYIELLSIARTLYTASKKMQVSLLINVTGIDEKQATEIWDDIKINLILEKEFDMELELEVHFIETITSLQWQALTSRLQGCIRLSHENLQAFEFSGAAKLHQVSVDSLYEVVN